jgi:hypothetical protein
MDLLLSVWCRTWIEGETSDKDGEGRSTEDASVTMSEFTLDTGAEETKTSAATSLKAGKHTWLYIQMELCNR